MITQITDSKRFRFDLLGLFSLPIHIELYLEMEATEILPGIFVGDELIARDREFFRNNNIVRVVNCTKTVPFYFPQQIQYFRIPVNDSVNELDNRIMATYLWPAIMFIMEIQPSKKRGVLIHCQMGISRSCTVAVGVLRYCCNPTVEASVESLLEKRKISFFGGRHVNFSKALYTVFGT
jgi:hypothetical protein